MLLTVQKIFALVYHRYANYRGAAATSLNFAPWIRIRLASKNHPVGEMLLTSLPINPF
ncbi:hypothetical protein IV78_GL001648 [Pediococcus acidilactici]|nr:hypothetical protein IV78_GL001648 [Pediococcus acidilactici]